MMHMKIEYKQFLLHYTKQAIRTGKPLSATHSKRMSYWKPQSY
jgi:hypothetical protein